MLILNFKRWGSWDAYLLTSLGVLLIEQIFVTNSILIFVLQLFRIKPTHAYSLKFHLTAFETSFSAIKKSFVYFSKVSCYHVDIQFDSSPKRGIL